MKLSDGERLILIMLADLQQKLGVDGEVDPALVKTAVVDNTEWALEMEYPSIFEGSPLPAVVQETLNILAMYRELEHLIDDLDEPDRSTLQAHNSAKFRGFDGNGDPHFGVATTFVRDLKRFDEFSGRSLNSHSSSTLPRFRGVYERYVEVSKRENNDLDAAAIKEILG